jgi:hypothetical protein
MSRQNGNTVKHQRLYFTWHTMLKRCYIGTSDNYEYYGGKGIGVCKEWRDDFLNFLDWALKNGYQDHLTIDRKDPDKDYCPDNCRWADKFTQAQNRGMDSRNTSGAKGVCPYKYGFRAYISRENNRTYLGSFITKEAATRAREAAEIHYDRYGTLEDYKTKVGRLV